MFFFEFCEIFNEAIFNEAIFNEVILGMKNILGYTSKKIAISNYITGFQKVNEAMKRKKSIVCVNHKDGQISF